MNLFQVKGKQLLHLGHFDLYYCIDNWYNNEKGYQKAIYEAWKIICYINEKSIPDFEI